MWSVRLVLVWFLWRVIRWEKRCIYWLLYPKPKKIKPLQSKNADGLRTDFCFVDEMSEWRGNQNG